MMHCPVLPSVIDNSADGGLSFCLLKTIVDGSNSGIMIVDKERRVRYANNWLIERWHPRGSDIIDRPVSDVVRTARRSRLFHAIDGALENQHSSYLTHYLNRGLLPLTAPGSADDADYVSQNVAIRPLAVHGGARLCLLEIQDVSAEVERERKLRRKAADLAQARDELQNLTRAVTNDLRVPMHMMTVLPVWIEEELMESGMSVPPIVTDYLVELKVHCNRLDLLFSDLVDYSSIDRNDQEPEIIDLHQLYRYIIQTVAPRPEISFEQRGDFPAVRAVRAELELVLRHLISNAIEHHDDQCPHIAVSAQSDGNRCRISVADDGPGIPANMHNAVFELFRSLRPLGQVAGTGIGLTMVRKTIESWGSRVELESPLEGGRGARFAFTVPLAAAAGHEDAAKSATRLPKESTAS
ncbi:MAG: HAMP domain-containing sensor histidine kinase [Geminicoccaceae bacterium]